MSAERGPLTLAQVAEQRDQAKADLADLMDASERALDKGWTVPIGLALSLKEAVEHFPEDKYPLIRSLHIPGATR